MLVGMQFMQDIGSMFAVHTQQYMSKETYVKVVGRYKETLQKQFGKKDNLRVSPYDLAVNYDVIVRDGSIPGGNFSDAWLQMFSTIASTPELAGQFDVFRLFSYIATQLGAKNVDDFKKVASETQMTQMPDQQVLDQAQAGNLVPLGA
jgi:hypothetical protein